MNRYQSIFSDFGNIPEEWAIAGKQQSVERAINYDSSGNTLTIGVTQLGEPRSDLDPACHARSW